MKIFRIICGSAVVFSLLFTALFGYKEIDKKKEVEKSEEYKGIISLWQIDTFEGGVGSRKKFLLDVAKTFEKQNSGVLVAVVSHTSVSAEENMKKGIFPDLISYGNGVEISGIKEINPPRTFKCGKIGGKTFAVPWCRGGYVLITAEGYTLSENKVIENIVISEKQYTMPTVALSLEGYRAEKYEITSPDKAYSAFVNGKYKVMLGTQRDIVKLNNRGFSYKAYPLTVFNDLYQYISLTSSSTDKSVYAERFIYYLLSDEVQRKLNKICMMSEYVRVDFDGETLNAMQGTSGFNSISPFIKPAETEGIKALSVNGIKINGELDSKIKNLLE